MDLQKPVGTPQPDGCTENVSDRRQYEAQKMTVKNSEGRNQHSSKEVCAQNGPNPRTAEIVAKEHGIGRNTVKRAAKFSKGVDAAEKIESGARDAILSGKSKVP